MTRFSLLVCALAACDQLWGLGEVPAPGPPIDAAPDSPDASSLPCDGEQVGGGMYLLCVPRTAPSALTLDGTINTDTYEHCSNDPRGFCAVAAQSITVMNLTVTGGQPLALAAGTLEIDGALDVSSDKLPGPGSTDPTLQCRPTTDQIGGNGGGPGGSFNGAGGGGGKAVAGAVDPGKPIPIELLTKLRAGCRGEDGRGGNGNSTGGFGGGAVYLAADQLTLGTAARVRANGAGGGGGLAMDGGAAGGGTGGLIVVDATAIVTDANAILYANGGGGGGGANNGSNGDPGAVSTSFTTGGNGGMKTGNSGAGGVGAAQASGATAGGGGGATAGAGGGGGALGYIIVYGTVPLGTANTSPSVTTRPRF